jgi:uncharacterized protein with HEPN domain
MPSSADARLRDILDASNAIAAFLSDVDFETFSSSDALTSRVYWKMAVIGEAAARALQSEPELQAVIPELLHLSDVRNRVIHGYETVSSLIIWTIIHDLLPPVLGQISDHLGQFDFGAE